MRGVDRPASLSETSRRVCLKGERAGVKEKGCMSGINGLGRSVGATPETNGRYRLRRHHRSRPVKLYADSAAPMRKLRPVHTGPQSSPVWKG